MVDNKFYFIGAQYMVVLEDGEYLPCEIGLVEWSMTNGVSKEYHTFVNPGKTVALCMNVNFSGMFLITDLNHDLNQMIFS